MKAVLVVDDEEAARRVLAQLLSMSEYRALTASHGAEALDVLEREESVSAIVLDVIMPVMDGLEFRRRQLRDPRFANIPVVVCSATYDGYADVTFDACVRKPIDFDVLLHTLAQLT